MSKRQAFEPLEDVVDAPSPASKRARVEDVDMEEEPYSDDDDETSRADEADDGVFGTMEE